MSSSWSYLALLGFYMVYLLMGGYIFYNIECAEEMAVKRREVAKERESMKRILEGLEHRHDEEASVTLPWVPISSRHRHHRHHIHHMNKPGIYNSMFALIKLKICVFLPMPCHGLL